MSLQGSVSQSYREQPPPLYHLGRYCCWFLLIDTLCPRIVYTDESLNPTFSHLDCNLNVIFAEVGNVHLEFFKLTPFSRKLSRDRRSQTIGTSQVHMAITLTITMVCRHNISFLQNSSHHCHPIDFPWKCWKRCWLLDGRLATEPTGSSLQTEQQPDETHTDWGWALSCRGSWPQKILLEHQKYSRITENIIIGPRGHTWSGHN